MHAAIAFTLVLDLTDPHDADLTRVVYVCAATGLEVDVFYADGSYVAGASRWLHRHRPDQLRAFVEFGFGDRSEPHRVRFRNELINACREIFLVDLVLTEIEIQSALLRPDRATRDWHRDQ